jgi:threonine synthase
LHEIRYRCDACGDILEVKNDFSEFPSLIKIKDTFKERMQDWSGMNHSGVWRYREFMPYFPQKEKSNIVTLFEGNTPLYHAPLAAQWAGMDQIWLKHQGMNPTGSFKDNGMTTGVSWAKVIKAKTVACASTGNTSASMAAYASRAGMKSVVFIPAGQIAFGKLSQALDYGALTLQIDGDFDKAMQMVEEIAVETGIYMLNSINPFRLEGQKTIMIEMMHQLNWSPPDWVVVPGGNLGNSSSFAKAFREMKEVGLLKKNVKLAVIQAEGANPLYQLFSKHRKSGKTGQSWLEHIDDENFGYKAVSHAHTLATAIKIGNPVSWKKSLRGIMESGGVVEFVTEAEIAQAKAIIGREGFGAEPASAASLAGIKKLVKTGIIKSHEQVVGILTGHVLKDPDFTVDFHQNQLFLDSKRKPCPPAGAIRIPSGKLANKPIRVKADKKEILKLISAIE